MSNALAALNALADEAKARRHPSTPLLVTDIAREIKAAGGRIWQILKTDYGLLLRAEFGKNQVRVIVPTPGQESTSDDVPQERSPTHVVRTLDELASFLQSLSAL